MTSALTCARAGTGDLSTACTEALTGGALRLPEYRVRNRVVVTNKTPTGLVRGFGGPQVYYALERLMDRIAVELGEVAPRAAPVLQPQQFRYTAAAGVVLDLA